VSLNQYYRAKELVRTNQIRLIGVNDTLIAFKTKYEDKTYSILYKRKEEIWSCTCVHGSLWGKGRKDCAHIIACKLLIKK
jgi:hypothetical protein